MDDLTPIAAFLGACLAIGLGLLWVYWTVCYIFERLCDVLDSIFKEEEPNGPFH